MALDYKTEYQRYRHYFTYLKPFFASPVTLAYFSVVASLVAITIFIAFAIRPTITTMVNLERQISDKTSLSAQLDAKINALNILSSDYQSIESFLPLVDLALPVSPEVSLALSNLEKIATSSGVKITSIAVGQFDYQQTATKSALITPIVINLTGDYLNFQAFLRSLGNLPRLVTVPELNLTTKAAKLTLNIYHYPYAQK